MRVPGVSSCMRLRARRNVDLPQPLGPMIAVTFFAGMLIVTSMSAWRWPYHMLKFLMSKAITSAAAGRPAVAAGAGDEEILMGSEAVCFVATSGSVDMVFNRFGCGR